MSKINNLKKRLKVLKQDIAKEIRSVIAEKIVFSSETLDDNTVILGTSMCLNTEEYGTEELLEFLNKLNNISI